MLKELDLDYYCSHSLPVVDSPGVKAFSHQVLVRAIRQDRPTETERLHNRYYKMQLPGWIKKRITQIVLYGDGAERTRTGYQGADGKVHWNKWMRLQGDKLASMGTDDYSADLIERGFLVRKADDKTLRAAAVGHAMERSNHDDSNRDDWF